MYYSTKKSEKYFFTINILKCFSEVEYTLHDYILYLVRALRTQKCERKSPGKVLKNTS